ncbi:MAG: cytochrome c [Vicinamibacterales bacterium]
MRKWTSGAIVALAVVAGISVWAAEKPSAEFQAAMKNAGGAMQSIGKATAAMDYAQVEKDAATLTATFQTVGKHFTEAKNDAALVHCKAAFEATGELAAAAKAKDAAAIGAATKKLGGACGACHMAHREKTADGFLIK